MRKIFFSFLFLIIFSIVPCIVFAQTNTLPEEVDGVITLTEDITLSEKINITKNIKINLNNHVLKLTKADNHFNSEVTIENGTIDISNVTHTGDGIIEVGNYGGTTGSLILNNVKFIGDSYNSSYAVIYVYGASKLELNNSTMNLSNESSTAGGVIKAQGVSGKINIINSTLNFTNTIRGFLDGTLLIKDSNVTIKATTTGGLDNAINTTSGGLACTIDNTTLNISNAIGRGITLDDTTLTIKNSSNISISNCAEGEIYAKTSGIINIDSKSYIDATISQRSGSTGKISVAGGIFKEEVNSEYLAEGYICKKVDENYMVVKENEITVTKNMEQGTVDISAEKAYIGDVITLTVNVNTGYEIEKIELIGLESNTVQAVENNQFTMPNEPVEVKVFFRKFIQELEIPTINKNEQVTDVTVGVENVSEVERVLLDTLMSNSELLEIAKNNNIKLGVEVKEIQISKEDETKINEKLQNVAQNINVLKYLDITIYVRNKDTQGNLTTLSTLNENITFTVALPPELQAKDDITNYYIVRLHNESAEIIDAKLSEDGKFLEFETKDFSTFAIAYSTKEENTGNEDTPNDNEQIENTTINNEQIQNNNNTQAENTNNQANIPSTGDDIFIYLLVAIISIIGLVYIRKIKNNNIKPKD